MYTVDVGYVTKMYLHCGDWIVKLGCGGEIRTQFLSADRDMIYVPDEMTMHCDNCPELDNQGPDFESCPVTKVERKNDANKAD